MRLRWKYRLAAGLLTAGMMFGQAAMPVAAQPEYFAAAAIEIGGVSYTDMGDFTAQAIDLNSAPAGQYYYKAGSGYVLWDSGTNRVTLQDASVTAPADQIMPALTVPAGAAVVAEGSNTLTGEKSYALCCENGGITVIGSGSLSARSLADNTTGWTYAVNAGSGDISIDIGGDFTTGDASSGGILTQGGSVTVKSGGAVSINGLVRAGNAVMVEAGTDLSITNGKNMAVQSVKSGGVSLTARTGNLTVSGGNDYNYCSIQGNSGPVALDAGGEIRVDDYDGYAGVRGSGLSVSGTVPADGCLHSNCDMTVPAGKTLNNNGTLLVNSGCKVTVAGTLVNGSGAAVKSGSSSAAPEVTGSGTVIDAGSTTDPAGPEEVSKLDLRWDTPTENKEYRITSGGTAKWEPGSNGAANKLTLNNVTMSGDSYMVRVPANTEIVLEGANSITDTSASTDAICVQDGVLKITGSGSLTVNASGAALYGNKGVDISIGGPLTVTGRIRGNDGPTSMISGGSVTVNGSIQGKNSILAEAGTSLSVVNAAGAAVFATTCTEVSLAAKGGDLTLKGTNNYAIIADSQNTEVSLAASGNLSCERTDRDTYSINARKVNLAGTVPENTTLYTYSDTAVAAGQTLTNNGTIRMYHSQASMTVEGTLYNNGVILNGIGTVEPEGSGSVIEKAELDFSQNPASAAGDGYSWDSASRTLTLSGFDNTASAVTGTAVILPDGAKIVLEGENKIASRDGIAVKALGALEISGSGSLTAAAGADAALDAQGAVTIRDCTVSLSAGISKPLAAEVIRTNGSALTIGGTAKVTCDVPNQNDASWGISTGAGSLTIEKDAVVTVTGAGVGILVDAVPQGPDVEVKINGTLDTAGCRNLCANLLGVILDMQGSSIFMKEGTHIWLHQSDDTLTGETDVTAFSGMMQVSTGNDLKVDDHKVTVDGKIGLYAVGSEVSFTAKEPEEGEVFNGWTAEGITLEDASVRTISFSMPDNDVTLRTNYGPEKPKLLEDVQDPEPVTGVASGTEKTAQALGLPEKIAIVTEDESIKEAAVTWDLENLAEGSYDPAVLEEQSFVVNGTVELPEGVEADGKNLSVQIRVTVSAAQGPEELDPEEPNPEEPNPEEPDPEEPNPEEPNPEKPNPEEPDPEETQTKLEAPKDQVAPDETIVITLVPGELPEGVSVALGVKTPQSGDQILKLTDYDLSQPQEGVEYRPRDGEGGYIFVLYDPESGTEYAALTIKVAKVRKEEEEPAWQEPACNHDFVWKPETEATATENARMVYECMYCGKVRERMDVANSAYAKFNRDAVTAIDKAAPGAAVTISTPLWISFHRSVIEVLKERPDVTVILNYRFKGERYTLTIPSGADLSLLEESEGYYGFRYLDGVFQGRKAE